jgi:hypothetical protein
MSTIPYILISFIDAYAPLLPCKGGVASGKLYIKLLSYINVMVVNKQLIMMQFII